MLWCYYAVILCIRFYICPDIPVEIIFFFSLRSSSRNSQSQQNLTKNITHFTIQFLSKSLTRFMNLSLLEVESNMLPQRIQKPLWPYKLSSKKVSVWCQQKNICTTSFLDAQELHSWRTLKASVCIFLYISLRKFLFQSRSKFLSGGRWDGGRLNNFLKATSCLSLANVFEIFHFNWSFWIFNYFLSFRYFYL